MPDNVLIPLPGFELAAEFPWQVGFVDVVNEQLRRLRATGHFLPPRFFGYYFRAEMPVGVGGSWTVSLDPSPSTFQLAASLERLTQGQYSIVSERLDAAPDYLLVHDRRDGACWLWSFTYGLRFIEAVEPTKGGDSGDSDDAEKRKLLGP